MMHKKLAHTLIKKIQKRPLVAALSAISILISILISLSFIIIPPHHNYGKYKAAMLKNSLPHMTFQPLFYDILSTLASLEKTMNIVHFPYWFGETRLPIFSVEIEPKDIRIMNNSRPENFYLDNLMSENKIFVPAVFNSGEYIEDIELRYRGAYSNHWTAAKRSLLIKFPKENLFNGIKSVDLVVPEDRGYLIEILNNERMRRSGLTPKNMFFARVRVNGKDAGVYLAKERFSKYWLEKNGIAKNSEIFTQTSDDQQQSPTLSRSKNIIHNRLWKRDINEKISSFNELEALFSLIQNPDKKIFRKNIGSIVDLEKWHKAMAINVLAGGVHSIVGNLNLIFNSATGKFEPLLEDIYIHRTKDYVYPKKIYEQFDPLSKRIFSDEILYSEYLEILKQLSDSEELELDLKFYDSLSASMRPEFYKDQTKRKNDFVFSKTAEEMRAIIRENYENAQFLATITEPPLLQEKQAAEPGSLTIPGNFKYLYNITLEPLEFIKKHPEFQISNGEIILPMGIYTFRENVIIPKGTRLTIRGDTKIYLFPDVSIISYSPIEALGVKDNPITISRARKDKNWGAVAVINTEEKSEFRYVTMIGGSSSEPINGVTFTGMLSAHNAPLYIQNSQFHKDGDDDAVNVKYSTGEIVNSQFFDTFGDAIDLDMTEGFQVLNNRFFNIGTGADGGDAIDISFSDAHISNNIVRDCNDKGVSVGEKSSPIIKNNDIEGCKIGIAVKDKSTALIQNNRIAKSSEGVSLYQKKAIFGGAKASLQNNIFQDNKIDVNKDELSEILYLEEND